MKTINSIILSSITMFNILSYNVDLIHGIQGGFDVPLGKFTYQAIVLINGKYACGGTVINSGNILSAGQCVLDEQGYFFDVTFEVIVGVISFNPNGTYSKIKVDYIYIKNNFRPKNSPTINLFPGILERGDLAVLKLRVLISSQLNVHGLEFPSAERSSYPRYSTRIANVSGFGRNSRIGYKTSSDLSNIESRLHSSGQLTYTQTRVLRENTCQRYYGDLRDDHICANSVLENIASGPCLGDAGDPLVFNNVLIGVMQYYIANCDNRDLPTVYTRISPFIEFIRNARDGSFQSDMRLGNYTGRHVTEVSYAGVG